MLKIFLVLMSCFTSFFCFSQPDTAKNTSVKPVSIQHLTKDSSFTTDEKTSLKIYPNPAKNKISIAVTGFEPGMVVVKIIDTKGKVWREDNRLLTDGTEEIPMFLQLKPGIYFISVNEKRKISRKKIIIL